MTSGWSLAVETTSFISGWSSVEEVAMLTSFLGFWSKFCRRGHPVCLWLSLVVNGQTGSSDRLALPKKLSRSGLNSGHSNTMTKSSTYWVTLLRLLDLVAIRSSTHWWAGPVGQDSSGFGCVGIAK